MRFLDKHFGKIAWILTGICFAAAGAVMLVCGSFNLDKFYDVGEVYDVAQVNMNLNGNYGINYDASEDVHIVMSENAAKVFVVTNKKWNYVYISFSYISSKHFDTDIACYDKSDTLVYQTETSFTEGGNVVAIPNVKYMCFYINFHEQKQMPERQII